MEKRFFETGDHIKDEHGKDMYCLLEPAKYNDKYYVAHAIEVSSARECLLKFAETGDDSYKLNNLKREGDFRFFYPYIERVYGNFSGVTPTGEKIYGVELEFIHGRDLKDFRVELEKKVVFDKVDEETAEWIIYRQIMQFLYGMRYYTEYSKQTYLHRDIKPENIMITDKGDDVVIVDFDFAHIAGSDRTRNITGWDVAFSRGYTSPDIFTNKKRVDGDISTDIYSAGRLIFYWINGVGYFTEEQMAVPQGGNLASTVYCTDKKIGYGIETNKERFKKKYRSNRYKGLRDIIARMCCDPDQECPYMSVTEIIGDMEDFLTGLCGGSSFEMEKKIRKSEWRLLQEPDMISDRKFVMVAYKPEGGVKVGQPLYDNSIRDIFWKENFMFSICNFGGHVTYIPSFDKDIEIHRNVEQENDKINAIGHEKGMDKTGVGDEETYMIKNGDIIVCNGVSFEFTII